MDEQQPDWDPRAGHVLEDQIAAYDEMRRKCPVAYSQFLQWSLFRYNDILRVLKDHVTFSSKISDRVSVPNSMDPPEHTAYRKIIEGYFTAEAMRDFEPRCREIAGRLVNELSRSNPVEFISDFSMKYALQVQCAFLGWPEPMQDALALWMKKNHAATLSQDRDALQAVASEFAGFIDVLLETRREAGDDAPDDVITSLMRSEVNGRALSQDEIVSILRNWTGGEVGTISASVGILVHFLADSPQIQAEVREDHSKLPEAIDEILRLHGPLVTNRRKTTCPVEIGGRKIGAGERISLFWVSANRDEEIFENADEFRWGRDQSKNLLYGAGVHVCPGAPLARLELRVVMEELLDKTNSLALLADKPAPRAVYPGSGFAEAHVLVS